MKSLLWLGVFGLMACGASSSNAATTADEQVKEMKECAVCRFIAEDPELAENMTWECHKISAGMLCVTSVPEKMKKEFDAVHKKMLEAIAKVKADQQAGKEVKLCSFCSAVAELIQSGAKQENVDTATGSITLVTATDPSVVQKIHAHADKAIADQKAMEVARK